MQPHNSNPDEPSDGDGAVSKNIGAESVDPLRARSNPEEDRVPTGYAPRTGLKFGFSALIVGIALIVAFLFVQQRKSRSEATLAADTAASAEALTGVEVARVTQAPTTQILTLPGETRAWYESTVYARVSGYLANWSADIGDRVKKGQVLATIETPDLDEQLSAAKAKIEVSNAEVAVMENNMVLAKSNSDRWQDSPKGVVSDLEREEKKAEYDSSKAKFAAAQAQVNLDQADVRRLTEMRDFRQVQAPFDGIITARRIDIGDLITAGSTTNTTSLYSIAQSDQIRVFVDVPQSVSVGLDPGLPATATASEYPGRVFRGQVARTSRSIDSNSRMLRVEVDIPNPDLALLPGMYVQVGFELKQQHPLLEVPASALLFRSSGSQVAVVDDDGKVHFRDVAIAGDQGEVIEIGSGISPNERVALNISNQVGEGDHVNAIDTEKVAAAPAPAGPNTATAALESH